MYSALTSEHDVEDTSVKNGNRLDMLHPSRYLAMQTQLGNAQACTAAQQNALL